MNWRLHSFISKRLTESTEVKDTMSKPIVKIAIWGIALGLAVMLLTVSMVKGFEHEVQNRIERLGSAISVESLSYGSEGNTFCFAQDSLQLLQKTEGVKAVNRSMNVQIMFKNKGLQDGLMCKGISALDQITGINDRIRSGRMINLDSQQPERSVIITEALSRRLQLNVGDDFPIHVLVKRGVWDSTLFKTVFKPVHLTRKWKVKAIIKNEFSDLDRSLVLTDIRNLQNLRGLGAFSCSNLEIQLTQAANPTTCNEAINRQLPYYLIAKTLPERFAVLYSWFDKLHVNALIIFILMLSISLVNMCTALLIFILEHTRLIGQLTALGYYQRGLQKIFVHIGSRFLLKGMVWGNLIAGFLGGLQYFFHLIKLDEATYYVSYVVIEPVWADWIGINVMFFCTGMATMVLPTMIISRISPMKTLTFD